MPYRNPMLETYHDPARCPAPVDEAAERLLSFLNPSYESPRDKPEREGPLLEVEAVQGVRVELPVGESGLSRRLEAASILRDLREREIRSVPPIYDFGGREQEG